MARKNSKTDLLDELTWEDLQEWAGTTIVSRGQSYQRNHHVQELAHTPSGGVIAWVQGTQRYATLVEIEEGELTSVCTCPYWDTCKHAVAVVLEYLEHRKQDIKIPTITDRDRRLKLLQGIGEFEDTGAGHTVFMQSRKTVADELHHYLEKQTKAELIALLEELAERYTTVLEDLRDRRDLSMGTLTELVDTVREEIQELGSEPDWDDYWENEG